jgi:hypothetical protein
MHRPLYPLQKRILILFGEKTVRFIKHRSSYATTGFSIRTLLHGVIMNGKGYGSLISYIPTICLEGLR